MTRRRLFALCALTLLSAALPLVVAAETPRPGVLPHIRTSDLRLRRLIEDGVRTSGTFRDLVDRLHRSDVVVFLDCDGPAQPAGGRLVFVSVAGGYRYVQVRVTRLRSADQQLAIIGHELQHAVEIADAPQVVDAPSLAREYERIGFVNRYRSGGGTAFDSVAAVQAGYRVLREMSSGASAGD
jgi:hypothetical protein